MDPLESALNQSSFALEDSLLSELARRVTDLEHRVQILASYDAATEGNEKSSGSGAKRKNRRKFKDLVRDQRVP